MTTLSRIDSRSNAFSFSFDTSLMAEIKSTYQRELLPLLSQPENQALFDGGKVRKGAIGSDNQFYYATYEKEPLFWVSNNNQQSYDLFKTFFEALDITSAIKKLVDYESEIVVYSGFFVVGDRADREAWHKDYAPGANAYTLITPLFEPDPEHGNLLYKDHTEKTHIHVYKFGEAIIFGDHFAHSTEPYPQTENIRVLLSLTFGTDKMEHWHLLRQTIGGQSEFMILPCGHQLGHCSCLNS